MVRKIFLILLVACTTKNFSQSQWTQTGSIIEGETFGGGFGQELVISGDGQTLAVANPFGSDVDTEASIPVTTYERQGMEWIETGRIANDDPDGWLDGDFFGFSMALSTNGSVLAVAVPRSTFVNTPQGRVKLYRNVQGTWTQIGSDITSTITGELFAEEISMSADGSIIAIGHITSGLVKVYKNNNDNWEQLGANLGTGNTGEFFGKSVSLSNDGTVLAIGVLEDFSSKGRVELYKFDNNAWTQIGNSIQGTNILGQFGTSTKLSGDGNTVIISSINPNLESVNYVEVYRNQNSQWTKLGNTIRNCEDCFVSEIGKDLAITNDGNLIAVGDPSPDENNAQNVDLYAFENSSWIKLQRISVTNSDTEDPELFGESLDFTDNGNILVVGSPDLAVNDEFVGGFRTYENDGVLSTPSITLEANTLVVYPNPFVNTITVDFKSIQKVLSIEILDIQGRKIDHLEAINTSKATLNPAISSGTYFVKIENQEGDAKTFKIIKQ